MATKITKIQVRRDTSLNWESVNPILSVGEFALTTDSQIPGGQFKIGDGQTPWKTLVPFGAGEKGTFLEVVNNGPFQGGSGVGFPLGVPNFSGIDGVTDPTKYATADKGVYVAGLATYHHIFPVDGFTDPAGVVIEPTIGRPNARFSEVYVKGNSLHIGDDDNHEIILSHLRGAIEPAVIKIVAVTPGGRVTATEFGRQVKNGLTVESRGLGYRVGQGLTVEYDPNYSTGSVGFGLRINVLSVDADGAIQDYEIQDAGGGYATQELVQVVLRSQLGIARREPFADTFTVTELATAEGLEQVTSQSLTLVGPAGPAVPYLSELPRSLPDTTNVVSQADFNAWATASLRQHDRQKLQIQNCTGLADGLPPNSNAQGLPEHKLLINNAEGPIHPGFGIATNTMLTGGEILYFNDLEQWEIVSGKNFGGSGDGGGTGGPEEDPIFTASDAARLVERDVNSFPTLTYQPLNIPSIQGKPLMYIDDWTNIPAL